MGEWIIETVTQLGYLGVFILMVVENIFPPIPSELIMPFAGFVAARGDLNVWGVLAAGTLGSLIGTSLWYFAARALGLDRFRALCNRLGRFATIHEKDIDEAARWFERYGSWAVFFGRLLPTIRTLISVPAGLAKMSVPKFILISGVGTALWTAILTAAGYVLNDQYERVEHLIDPVSTGVVVLAVVIYIYRFITWKPIKTIG
jgi:membrane protein DedA with SNARE-associated domain